MKTLDIKTLTVVALLVMGGSGTHAHEFIVKPAAMTAAKGSKLAVSAISSHVFMISEELEEAKDVKIGVFVAGKHADAEKTANKNALTYEASLAAPSSSSFIVTGARLPQIWAKTPEGTRQATNKTPGASNAFKIEKFSKALVNVSANDDGFSALTGDPLEIVPITNPATLKIGDEMTVKVLFKGQPLSTNIYATYDGFSKHEDTYAYFTEGKSDGTAFVKITQPGLWMVRVQHASPEKTDEYDRYVGRAVLLFEVKG